MAKLDMLGDAKRFDVYPDQGTKRPQARKLAAATDVGIKGKAVKRGAGDACGDATCVMGTVGKAGTAKSSEKFYAMTDNSLDTMPDKRGAADSAALPEHAMKRHKVTPGQF
jgi:hypothetical protein